MCVYSQPSPTPQKVNVQSKPVLWLVNTAASPLALLRFQAWRKVMGIELRLSRAPGFVISKGSGRFQALSLHAMSWHLTHKVALVLAYLQAADSDCQQRGENEREGNRSYPRASFRKAASEIAEESLLFWFTDHRGLLYRNSRRLSSHMLF